MRLPPVLLPDASSRSRFHREKSLVPCASGGCPRCLELQTILESYRKTLRLIDASAQSRLSMQGDQIQTSTTSRICSLPSPPRTGKPEHPGSIQLSTI